MRRLAAIATLVILPATGAGIVVRQAAQFSDSLERAVESGLWSNPTVASSTEFGVIDTHPADYSGVLHALDIVIRLTFAGLLVGGVPLGLTGLVVEWRSARRPARWLARRVTLLQAAFTFQLCSLVVTLLFCAFVISIDWPIRTVELLMVAGYTILAGSTVTSLRAIRSWVRLRVQASNLILMAA